MMTNIYDLEFNNLPKEDRIKTLIDSGEFMNPFKIPEGAPMIDPYTYKVVSGIIPDGIIPDGIKIIYNAFTGKITSKILFEDNKAIKAWEVTSQNTWKQVK